MHAAKNLSFIVSFTLAAAQIEPTVVVQKCAVGMRPFLFKISKEIAPQLAGIGHAYHRGISDGLSRA